LGSRWAGLDPGKPSADCLPKIRGSSAERGRSPLSGSNYSGGRVATRQKQKKKKVTGLIMRSKASPAHRKRSSTQRKGKMGRLATKLASVKKIKHKASGKKQNRAHMTLERGKQILVLTWTHGRERNAEYGPAKETLLNKVSIRSRQRPSTEGSGEGEDGAYKTTKAT